MQIKDGQKFALIKLCQRFTKGRHERLWFLSQLLGKTIETSDELSIEDWRKIRDMAYSNWSNDDWEVSQEFLIGGWELHRQYEKEIVGQGELF